MNLEIGSRLENSDNGVLFRRPLPDLLSGSATPFGLAIVCVQAEDQALSRSSFQHPG